MAQWLSWLEQPAHNRSVLGSSPRRSISFNIFLARWLSWLERRPVTAEVVSSSLIWVVTYRMVCAIIEYVGS